MSTSDLYVLFGKSTRHFAEFRNGWGSAPIAWDYLADRYIAEKPAYSLSGEHMKRVWALASDPRLSRAERIVLMLTFDRAFVPLAHLLDAAEACIAFGAACEDGRRANHWPAIGEALRRAHETNLGRHARGICLSCTSVSDPWIDPTPAQLAEAWSIYEEPELAAA